MNFPKKRCVAMLLAGGQGSRLLVLTENTAKPAEDKEDPARFMPK